MNRLLVCIFILSSLVSCASQKSELKREKKAKLYYNQGTSNLYSGNYTEALRNLLESYKYQPDDSKLLNNLGMAYFFKKSYINAKKFINKALQEDPKNSDARMNLATIYMSEKNYQKAREQYILITEDLIFSKQFKTYHNLAMLELKSNNTAEAKNFLKKSIESNESYCPAFYELGKIHFNEGSYQEAQKSFKEASMGLCYKKPEPRFFRAKAFVKLNQYFEATQILQDMVETFAMTKWEGIATKALKKIKTIHDKSIFDTLEAKSSKKPLSSPNF